MNTNMNYILNIGMDRNDGPANTDGQLMMALLRADIIHMGEVAYVQSNTERTAVVQVEREPNAFQVEYLCQLLGQESIALYSEHSKAGVLYGPKAEEWGPFNPDYFMLPDGTKLSSMR
jgi:hypothetical protein